MNISVPDELAEQVRTLKISISETCQRALRRAVEAAKLHNETGMKQIILDVGKPAVKVGFVGRWLVPPDPDKMRTREDGYDPGLYWGVALTKRGRIAVYMAHRNDDDCNDGDWADGLFDYDSLDDAQRTAGIPADIIAIAARGITGEERVLWRDI